ncbi:MULTISPECIES: sulfurtransferase [unclassified Paenibacillus]|uniref:sulfurtransferase n=1 Tax=unclassified Paenibacillus TaxID=185978 RepID=UPI002404B7D1|nr:MULTISPECIES: sulfurtransferase [unclassified Paenibacillus]MDF9839071.1 thiosulfate/3-mercaptopyruvate sulfurtransferase [Paenibacillus sp. PastF-2]MDF9845653.1 thiosulfate/3-mercaptopyruvate sulfurtransferase [Paenibacillus sp. PastM-2]MDF9852225.1 thiosulfate/3-mercaptopyruvate sulfurtransferase [Paenibacillus sp. PastF-1]MDH6478046.1 thiosulfate/3-mercaptopyruvate sulfurtransferase [Paenibacillus sp. PastH-2]MDH6505781.1 thiosulfate/3-mercaptopyruvate sulfurtransferase [Paenibacillus sp
MDATVSKRWLLARLYDPEQTIVDCRFTLGKPQAGRESYEQEHIPGAVYLDLELDLSSPVTEHGGRHPLPDPQVLAARLSRLGISNDTRIVAYDDESGMNAARLWWLLRYLGHEQVFILEDSFSTWKEAKYPVTDHQPVRVPSTFTANVQPQMLAGVDEVRAVSEKTAAAKADAVDNGSSEPLSDLPILIDSRAGDRFQGQNETMDKKAGHIPGAVNYFWKNTQNADGSYKSAEQLAEHFTGLDKDREIIVYCGSGVTACPNVLALEKAGFKNVRLYAGSWSDWISYEDNPIASGEE